MSRSPKAEAMLAAAPEEQIAAAIGLEKWARAAGLLELHGERLLLDGDLEALAGWFEAMPDEHITRHGKLAALFAWVRIYDQRYQDALVCLSKAERVLQRMQMSAQQSGKFADLPPINELEQSLAAIRLHLQAVTGRASKLPKHVEEIMIPASSDHPLWRAGALVSLGRTRYLAGDLRGAADDLEAAEVLASTSQGGRATRIAADAGVLLGRIAEAQGRLDVAARRYDALVAAKVNVLAAEVGLARVALLRLDQGTARTLLERVRAAIADGAENADPVRVLLEGELAWSTLQLIEGQADEARATLDQLEKSLATLKLRWPVELIGPARARCALIKKDDSVARRWIQQFTMRRDSQPAASPAAANDRIVEALVQVALHEPKLGLVAARDAMAFAEATGNKVIALEAQVAMALAHYADGTPEDARSALMAALEGAKATGVMSPLFVRGLAEAASELGLSSGESAPITRAAARLPVVAPRQERSEAPNVHAPAATGPIETAKIIAPEVVALRAEADEAPEVDEALEAEDASDDDDGVAAQADDAAAPPS